MKDIKVQFAKDGITVEKVIVGEDHYQVTLITPVEPIAKTPETTLTVPESVEFVDFGSYMTLMHNDLILSGIGGTGGFVLRDKLNLDRLETLKLIPCKLEEVKNGEWVVCGSFIDELAAYRLKTEKGWVSFLLNHLYPIAIQTSLSGGDNWLKVAQG